MPRSLSLYAFGQATSLFCAITFALCVGFHVLFPNQAIYRAFENLLPGFTWINWTSFGVGLLESYGYGWFAALIWVPLYNVFVSREAVPNARFSKKAA
jgi:hypothetical protein